MNYIAYFVLLVIALYTLGFAVTLWKEKQKSGAITVFVLALILVVLPFFSLF